MNRLLTGTAVGLLLGLTPALAQTGIPSDQTQNPPAAQQPAIPSDRAPVGPDGPAQPIPDTPVETQSMPDVPRDAFDSSAEMPPEVIPPHDGAMPDGTITEAPKSIMPEDGHPAAAALTQKPRFLSKQEPGDWLASNLIGRPVTNTNDEPVGDIDDLVTDKDGKVIAVIIGAGGFLGIGEKDVAVSYEDLQLGRDERNNVKVVADLSNSMLSTAPDYERLDEQELTVGDNVTVYGADEEPVTDPGIY